jgi:hypothetical protein
MRFNWIFASAVALILPAAAEAIETMTPPKETVSAMKKLEPHMSVEGWFKGPGNLVGVAARFKGQPMVFFTDPQGKYMVTGTAVDLQSGANMIAEATVKYFAPDIQKVAGSQPFPNPVKSAIGAEELARLQGISQGDKASGNKAYVIFDFGCKYCMKLYETVGKEKISGEIVWLPVTMSGEASTTKAALALGLGKMDTVAKLNGRALTDAVVLNKEALGRGALAAETNTNFVKQHNLGSTPYFFFSKNGVLMEHDGYANADGIIRALGVQ